MNKLFRSLGYPLFGVASLLVFFYVTFPEQAVGQRLVHEVHTRSGGKLTLSYEDVSLYRLSGVAVEGVKLRTNPEEGEPMELEVDEVHVRLRLLPLVLLTLSASVGVQAGDGSVEAVISKEGDGIDLEVEIDDLDFGSPAVLTQLAGLPINGKIAGKIKAKIGYGPQPRKGAERPLAPDRAEGQASLTIRDASIGAGTVQGFTVPAPISLGQLDFALDMKRGRARVASFQQKGGQVELQISASSSLRRSLASSTLESCVKLKFTDGEYLDKYPKMATALQFAQAKFKKDGEGFLNIKHVGTIGSPKAQRGVCRSGGHPSGRRSK